MTQTPDIHAKAETLIEALPYFQRYAGRSFVISLPHLPLLWQLMLCRLLSSTRLTGLTGRKKPCFTCLTGATVNRAVC